MSVVQRMGAVFFLSAEELIYRRGLTSACLPHECARILARLWHIRELLHSLHLLSEESFLVLRERFHVALSQFVQLLYVLLGLSFVLLKLRQLSPCCVLSGLGCLIFTFGRVLFYLQSSCLSLPLAHQPLVRLLVRGLLLPYYV